MGLIQTLKAILEARRYDRRMNEAAERLRKRFPTPERPDPLTDDETRSMRPDPAPREWGEGRR